MSAERLCTDFSELRPGILIRYRGCAHCGGDDVCIITNQARSRPDAWLVEPSCTGNPQYVASDSVADRKVFIIDTGLEEATTTPTRARAPRQVERSRP